MKLNTNIKSIDIKKLGRRITSEKSSWQKSLLVAVLVSLVVFIAASAYLFFKPLNEEIKKIVEAEISSTNINFDKKTLENIQKRYQPQSTTQPTGSKDPFALF